MDGSDHFPFFSWVICEFQPFIFQGVNTKNWLCFKNLGTLSWLRTLFFVNSGQKNPKKLKRAKLSPNFEKLGQESCLSLGLLKFPSTQLPYSTQNLSSFTSEKKEPSNKITMATNGGFFVSSSLLFPILGFSTRMPRFSLKKKIRP